MEAIQNRYFIHFPATYATTQEEYLETFKSWRHLKREDLVEAAKMLVTEPIVTSKDFTIRLGFSGLLLIDCEWSTYMACRRMLIHWGFIDG